MSINITFRFASIVEVPHRLESVFRVDLDSKQALALCSTRKEAEAVVQTLNIVADGLTKAIIK